MGKSARHTPQCSSAAHTAPSSTTTTTTTTTTTPQVNFPSSLALTDAQRKVLKGILAPPGSPAGDAVTVFPAGAPVSVLEEIDMEARKMRERLAKDAYDSDEERGGGGQRVQCANQ